VESAITTKGQATIPKAIREHLGLKPGGASYSVDRRSARLSMASPLVFLSFRPPLSERPLEGMFNSALQVLKLFLCCSSARSPQALQGRPSNKPRTARHRLGY